MTEMQMQGEDDGWWFDECVWVGWDEDDFLRMAVAYDRVSDIKTRSIEAEPD